jgi:hypothetical protein
LPVKKYFPSAQIVSGLKQAKVGVSVAELIRIVETSEHTFYRWKATFVHLQVDQIGCGSFAFEAIA